MASSPPYLTPVPGVSELRLEPPSGGSFLFGWVPFAELSPRQNPLRHDYTGGKFNGGVVFRYDTVSKAFDVLYDFCKQTKCADGQYPQAGVTFDPVTGILYGATQAGGNGNSKGVLYALTDPTGTAAQAAASFVSITKFCASGGICADGSSPGWAPAPDGAGHLIGATYGGGASGAGLIYEVTITTPAQPKGPTPPRRCTPSARAATATPAPIPKVP
jgi:uncharacterized repeat protein (TIGR03803 family)